MKAILGSVGFVCLAAVLITAIIKGCEQSETND